MDSFQIPQNSKTCSCHDFDRHSHTFKNQKKKFDQDFYGAEIIGNKKKMEIKNENVEISEYPEWCFEGKVPEKPGS